MSELLIAALTASTRANRPWQRRPGLQAPAIRWQPEELLLVSGCSGHADRSGPDVDAAASCSYLSDCMSLSGHRHLLRALCWLAWCSRQTSGARLDRRRTRPMQGCCGRHRSTSGSAAALVLMQAARLPPAPTRNAAEPTAPPNAAATSADTDGNGRVCVDGLGPYALLLKPQPESRRPADTHHLHAPHAPHAGRSW